MEVYQFPIIGKKIQYSDVVFPFLFLAFIFSFLKQRIKWAKTYLFIPIFFYLLIHIVSVFNSTDILRSFLEISGVIYLMAMTFVVINIVRSKEVVNKVLISWMFALGIVLVCALIGLAEVYIFKRHTSLFMLSYPAPARYQLMHRIIPRVISTLRSPNMLMSYLIVSTGLLTCFWASTQKKTTKLLIGVLLSLAFFITIFTTSRGVLGLLICIIIALSVFKKKKTLTMMIVRNLLSIVAAVLFVAFTILIIWSPSKIVISDSAIPGERNLSIDFHRTNKSYYYRYALAMVKDHPFIGVGSGNFNTSLTDYYYRDKNRDPYFKDFVTYDPHSTYLGLAAEIGLLGLLSFLGIIILFLKYMYDIYKNSREQYLSNLALGIFASTVGILVQGIAMDVQNLRHLWFILGLGIALKNLS
jgi:O-antigen ligase